MNKKYYSFGNPVKVRFRNHYCFNCGTELSIIKHNKVVTQNLRKLNIMILDWY